MVVVIDRVLRHAVGFDRVIVMAASPWRWRPAPARAWRAPRAARPPRARPSAACDNCARACLAGTSRSSRSKFCTRPRMIEREIEHPLLVVALRPKFSHGTLPPAPGSIVARIAHSCAIRGAVRNTGHRVAGCRATRSIRATMLCHSEAASNCRVRKGALFCAPCARVDAVMPNRVGTARELLPSQNIWKGVVAVGTLIAERPPHRSGHEAFPLTAPTSGPNASSNTR